MTDSFKHTRLSTAWVVISALGLLVIWCTIAAGSGSTDPQIVPDEEKRSCIQCVDGYAYLSENMTLAQTREAALTNAKRQAVAMAETAITSKTVVENFVLVNDVVEGSAAGAVTIHEQKDFGVEENRRYHVWIKAEVFYGFEPKDPRGPVAQSAGGAAPLIMDSAAPLTVKVWTPKKTYRSGEQIEVYLKGNKDFYARIVDIMPGGEIIQLLPNDFRRSAFFQGGTVYKIPDAEDRFRLTVTPPFGEDRVVVYASDVPLGAVDMEPAGQGLNRYRGTRGALAIGTRGIAVAPAAPGAAGVAEFYEGGWVLATSP